MFGIDEKGRTYPMKNTPKKLYTIGEHCVLTEDNVITAPLFQQAFRWFREKYDLFCYVELVGDRLFDYMIIGDFVEEEIDYEEGPFNTHEEAELACLQKLIEIVKEK